MLSLQDNIRVQVNCDLECSESCQMYGPAALYKTDFRERRT